MQKRERLEKTLAGETTDRLPVAIWRHFPGDDQRSADLAQSIADYQTLYDWDFIQIIPSANYMITGYGAQDTWHGNVDGIRDVSRHLIQRSLDWTELRTQDALRGEMGKQLECIRLLGNAFPNGQIPFIATIYSPLAQAARLSGDDLLIQNMRTHPDRLRSGLNILTESTLRLVEALRRVQIDGICYVIEHANYNIMTEAEYQEFGGTFDYKILESLPQTWWLNTVELQGVAPMLRLFANYRAQMIRWATVDSHIDLARGRGMVSATVSGGFGKNHLLTGTPTMIREAVRDAINQSDGGKGLILGATGRVPITIPMSNLRAARDAVTQGVR